MSEKRPAVAAGQAFDEGWGGEYTARVVRVANPKIGWNRRERH